ncbi:MAG: hypothetical protein JWO89_3579 [Verrucomicrobiaceae bacterium]|nr:hypothetical protein [Verrucomicrobiaceae bacterium]
MKASQILALALVLAASNVSRADDGEALAISTMGGQSYSHCNVVHIYPDGVAFRHSHGMAKILFVDLTPEWRRHFGYDAAKVEAYECKVREDRAKEREIAAARAAERQKAWNEAYVQQLQALAVAEALGGSQGGFGGGYGYLDVGPGGNYGFGNDGCGGFNNRGHGWGRNVGNNYNYGLGNYSWITKPQYQPYPGSGQVSRVSRGNFRGITNGGASLVKYSGGSSRGGHGSLK